MENLRVYADLIYSERDSYQEYNPQIRGLVAVPSTNAHNPFGRPMLVGYAAVRESADGVLPAPYTEAVNKRRDLNFGVIWAFGGSHEVALEVTRTKSERETYRLQARGVRPRWDPSADAYYAALTSSDPGSALNVFGNGEGQGTSIDGFLTTTQGPIVGESETNQVQPHPSRQPLRHVGRSGVVYGRHGIPGEHRLQGAGFHEQFVGSVVPQQRGYRLQDRGRQAVPRDLRLLRRGRPAARGTGERPTGRAFVDSQPAGAARPERIHGVRVHRHPRGVLELRVPRSPAGSLLAPRGRLADLRAGPVGLPLRGRRARLQLHDDEAEPHQPEHRPALPAHRGLHSPGPVVACLPPAGVERPVRHLHRSAAGLVLFAGYALPPELFRRGSVPPQRPHRIRAALWRRRTTGIQHGA